LKRNGVRPRGRTSRDTGDLLELVDLLYAAAVDESGWDAFLARLGALTESDVVPFLVWDYGRRDGQCLRAHPLDETALREYVTWAPKNPYVRQNPRLQTGEVRIIESTDAAVRGSEFYNDWLRPRLGVGHNLSSCVLSAKSLSVHLSPLRDPRRPAYGAEEVRFMRALMPHLLRGCSLQHRLGEVRIERDDAAEALDRLPTAVFLLGRDGRCRFFNAEARRLLGLCDGLILDRAGRLTGPRPSEAGMLERLVAESCATGAGQGLGAGGAVRLSRPSGRRAFQIFVSPMRAKPTPHLVGRACAITLVSDPDRPAPRDGEVLEQLFGLTPAEARVAGLLGGGHRVTETADLLGVSEGTVRTHLKRILEKSESRTQVDLMRALCAVPPAGPVDGEGEVR
jgi:DNA-binding CsgD family transcriptional regulator